MSKQYIIKSKFLNSLNEALQKMSLAENTKIIKNPILEADGNFTSIINSDETFDPSKVNSNVIIDREENTDTLEKKNELTDKAINKIKQSLSISDELQSILNEIDKINKDTDYNNWKLNDKQNTAILKSKNANIFLQNNHICLSHDGKIELFKSVEELHDWLRKNNYPLPKDIKLHESTLNEKNIEPKDENLENLENKQKERKIELQNYLGPWFDILYDSRDNSEKAIEQFEISKILYPNSKTKINFDSKEFNKKLNDIFNSLKQYNELLINKNLNIQNINNYENPIYLLHELKNEQYENNAILNNPEIKDQNEINKRNELNKFLSNTIKELSKYDHFNYNNSSYSFDDKPTEWHYEGYPTNIYPMNLARAKTNEKLIPYEELYAEKYPKNNTIYNKLQTDESIKEDDQINDLWYLIYQNKNRPEELYLNSNWKNGNILTNDINQAFTFINREDSINELKKLYTLKKCDYPLKPIKINSLSECGVTCGSLGPAVQYTANKNLKEDDLLDEMSKPLAKDSQGNAIGSFNTIRKMIGADTQNYINSSPEGREQVVNTDKSARSNNMSTKTWNMGIDWTKSFGNNNPWFWGNYVTPGAKSYIDDTKTLKINDIEKFKEGIQYFVNEIILKNPEYKNLEPLTPEELMYKSPDGTLKYDPRFTNMSPDKAKAWKNAWKNYFNQQDKLYNLTGNKNRSKQYNDIINSGDEEAIKELLNYSDDYARKKYNINVASGTLKQATKTCLLNDRLKPYYEQGISIINNYNEGNIDDDDLTIDLRDLINSDNLFKINKKTNKKEYDYRSYLLQGLKEYCTEKNEDNTGNSILKINNKPVFNTLKKIENKYNINWPYASFIEEDNFNESSLSNEFLKLLIEADTPADFATNLNDKNKLSNDISNSSDNTIPFDTGSSDQTNDLNDDSIDLPGDNINEPNANFGDININSGSSGIEDYGPEEDNSMMNMPIEPEDEYKIIDILVNDDNKNDIKLKVKNLTTNEIEEKDLSEIDI